MVSRPFWIRKIHTAWKKRPVVWLSGVRRAGKTTIARMLHGATYMNCDLPSVNRQMADPEPFYDSLKKGTVVIFDEIHRLDDPSRVLKIAADAYPGLKVLATGSSTLAATRKFRDSLSGRKQTIYLPPVLWSECMDEFGIKQLDRRLLHGGLPEPLMSEKKDTSFFSEWMDSFYARDIQELFGIRNRTGFMKLLHLLMRQSGGLVDYSHLAQLSDLSRHTVNAHVEAMSIAHAVYLLSPFQGGGRREITRRPKCYCFDTGFVTFVRGWDSIREDDRGLLWEHLVLDTLRTITAYRSLHYWRDKSGREIDFVIEGSRKRVDAVECKINPDDFKPSNLAVFRSLYPDGRNFVLSPNVMTLYRRRYGELEVSFISIKDLSIPTLYREGNIGTFP
ncbi:MAG: ATP-binding protein [Nitrospirae bacterium]|nr:ATP-binding protein [Nitrospirota bacterium]